MRIGFVATSIEKRVRFEHPLAQVSSRRSLFPLNLFRAGSIAQRATSKRVPDDARDRVFGIRTPQPRLALEVSTPLSRIGGLERIVEVLAFCIPEARGTLFPSFGLLHLDGSVSWFTWRHRATVFRLFCEWEEPACTACDRGHFYQHREQGHKPVLLRKGLSPLVG